MLLLFYSCSFSSDTGEVHDSSVGDRPYASSEQATISQGQEIRWLIEYSNASDVQFLFSSQATAELQFSVFSSEGNLLWSIESSSPTNESFRIDPDCEDYCSFVAKAYVFDANESVLIDLHVLASTYDAILITPVP